jgi:aromatic ring hydroxylase
MRIAAKSTSPRLASSYSEICDSVRELMGAGVFQMPADVSVLSNVSTRVAFETYWSVPGQSAEKRMKLFKLAWDLLGSDFAGRHLHLRWAGVCDEQLQLSCRTMEGVDRNGRPPDGEL